MLQIQHQLCPNYNQIRRFCPYKKKIYKYTSKLGICLLFIVLSLQTTY